MPKILVVNNYHNRDLVKRLENCVKTNGASVRSIEYGDASSRKFNSCDGVVLSGSYAMVTDGLMAFQREIEAIMDSNVPILGVCFGHQLIGRTFGAEVVKDRRHVLGMVKTSVVSQISLFRGLPKSLLLLESRHEVVKSLPKGFNLLAKSATTKIAAMEHEKRLLYGIQFHPERYTVRNPDGNLVVGNFVSNLK